MALVRVELASFGAIADEAGRGQRAGHGPVAVGVEDAEQLEQIVYLSRLPVCSEEFAAQPRAEVGVGQVGIRRQFAIGEADGAHGEFTIRIPALLQPAEAERDLALAHEPRLAEFGSYRHVAVAFERRHVAAAFGIARLLRADTDVRGVEAARRCVPTTTRRAAEFSP